MIRSIRMGFIRHLAAIASVVAALGVTLSARSTFEDPFYALFLVAVLFSSWEGGLAPGVVAAIASVFLLDFYFAPAPRSRTITSDDLVHLVIFLMVAVAVNHMNRKRKAAEGGLKQRRDELEIEVARRTTQIQESNAMLSREVEVRGHAEANLRKLSAQLLHLQDEERRRIARELHETIAQSLAALKMDLSIVDRSRDNLDLPASEALTDARSLTEQSMREVRTLSYLLHPPLLDEAGLPSALSWYCHGFTKRSGIEVALDLDPSLERLSQEMETTVFRLVQECLTNIHRHAGSPDARIGIRRERNRLAISITDRGRGMTRQQLEATTGSGAGVGVSGMRERVKQMGGQMSISSNPTGTTVSVQLPLIEESRVETYG